MGSNPTPAVVVSLHAEDRRPRCCSRRRPRSRRERARPHGRDQHIFRDERSTRGLDYHAAALGVDLQVADAVRPIAALLRPTLLQQEDLLHAGVAISKAQAIVGELRQSLNMEAGGDIAGNLSRLYAYLHDLLVEAMRENRAEPLEEATNLLSELRTAWVEVAKQAKA